MGLREENKPHRPSAKNVRILVSSYICICVCVYIYIYIYVINRFINKYTGLYWSCIIIFTDIRVHQKSLETTALENIKSSTRPYSLNFAI
jgi:hypothetical protein